MWNKFSLQQKLLSVVAIAILVPAFLFILQVWGLNIGNEIMAKVVVTCTVVGVVVALMSVIVSQMKEEKKDDKDNFFN